MIESIIWLFVFSFIIYKKVKKTSGAERTIERKNRTSTYQRPVSQQTKKNFAVMPEHKKVAPNVERKCMVEDKHQSENNVFAKRPVNSSTTPNVSRPYTELPKESKIQKKENRMVALRLYEGDHVPQGYRMVKCSYCAAENLIAYSSRGKYMCYFCHEDL